VNETGPEGIGGWLLALGVLLVVVHPLALAFGASAALSSIATRGWPAIMVLVARMAARGVGVAAGIALLFRRDAAIALVKVSLISTAATELFVIATPYYPSNRVPGDEPLYIAVTLAYYGVWMTYLFRSRRVRNTFGRSRIVRGGHSHPTF
jgi:hypothetical protein